MGWGPRVCHQELHCGQRKVEYVIEKVNVATLEIETCLSVLGCFSVTFICGVESLVVPLWMLFFSQNRHPWSITVCHEGAGRLQNCLCE